MSLKNPDTATRFVWKLWPKGLDSSIRGPKHQPETPDWWMPTLKYTFSISLPLFSSKLLKQTLGPPGTSPPCKSTKLCCVMRREVKRRALSYVPSLCWTKKRSWDHGRETLPLPERLSTPQERNSEQSVLLNPSRQLNIGLFMSQNLHFLLFLSFSLS